MIGKLGLIMLVVKDMDRSVQFYRDVLGVPLVFQTPHWSQLDAGNIRLGLHPESDHLKASPSEGCSFGFYVDNIQKIVAELKAKAVKVLQEPQKEQFGWLALVADPDGYVVQLFQTGAQAQTG